MEAFSLEVASDLIGLTEQTRGVRVVNLLVPTEEEGGGGGVGVGVGGGVILKIT
jgi:hypothetical protein